MAMTLEELKDHVLASYRRRVEAEQESLNRAAGRVTDGTAALLAVLYRERAIAEMKGYEAAFSDMEGWLKQQQEGRGGAG